MRKIIMVTAFLTLAAIGLTLGGCGWHSWHGWRGCRYGDNGYARQQSKQSMPTAGPVNVGMRY